MDPADFRPVPTCEIPPPVVEREGRVDGAEGVLPRILLQAAGMASHSRKLLLLTVVFAVLSALEAVLLVRLEPRHLVVYQEPALRVLLEDIP